MFLFNLNNQTVNKGNTLTVNASWEYRSFTG
jgi:hypothetical protein